MRLTCTPFLFFPKINEKGGKENCDTGLDPSLKSRQRLLVDFVRWEPFETSTVRGKNATLI